MAESLVVSGLVSKRAEVAGKIASYQTEISQLQGSLAHLDGSIKLFACGVRIPVNVTAHSGAT